MPSGTVNAELEARTAHISICTSESSWRFSSLLVGVLLALSVQPSSAQRRGLQQSTGQCRIMHCRRPLAAHSKMNWCMCHSAVWAHLIVDSSCACNVDGMTHVDMLPGRRCKNNTWTGGPPSRSRLGPEAGST